MIRCRNEGLDEEICQRMMYGQSGDDGPYGNMTGSGNPNCPEECEQSSGQNQGGSQGQDCPDECDDNSEQGQGSGQGNNDGGNNDDGRGNS